MLFSSKISAKEKVSSFQSWDEPISRGNYIKLYDETVWYHKIQPSILHFLVDLDILYLGENIKSNFLERILWNLYIF